MVSRTSMSRSWSSSISSSTSTSAVPDRHRSAPVARLAVCEQKIQRRERAVGFVLGGGVELQYVAATGLMPWRAQEQREVHHRDADRENEDHSHRELQVDENFEAA
jgi:hypothetical protein